MTGFNLSTYRYADRRITITLYFLLSACVIFFGSYNYISYNGLRKDRAAINSDVVHVKSEIAGSKEKLNKTLSDFDKKVLNDAVLYRKEIEGINLVLERKVFSWSEILYSLEKVIPENVSITKIQPNYEKKKIKIMGISKRLKEITTLVDNLRDIPYIKDSLLLKEETELVNRKYPAISFEIESEGKF